MKRITKDIYHSRDLLCSFGRHCSLAMKDVAKCGPSQKSVNLHYLISQQAMKPQVAIYVVSLCSTQHRLSNDITFTFSSLFLTELEFGKVLSDHFETGHRRKISFSGTQASEAQQSSGLHYHSCVR